MFQQKYKNMDHKVSLIAWSLSVHPFLHQETTIGFFFFSVSLQISLYA